jgi:pectate lyase
MMPIPSLLVLSALLPAVFALAWSEGAIPKPTRNSSSTSVIEIAPGEVFDGGFARYDRGLGACNEQAEGSTSSTPFTTSHSK